MNNPTDLHTFRHLDLFSGIGGFALACSKIWGGSHQIVAFCERDKMCQQILKKHWPDADIIDDIRELKGDQYGSIDLVTGGFPCQPFSSVGKQQGKADDRYLWPEMLRVIEEARPRWIIGENVIGIIPLALDQVLFDLEANGYDAWPIVIPACAVGARHIRRRVWILAHSNAQGIPQHVGECGKAVKGLQKEDIWGQDYIKDIILSGNVAPNQWTQKGSKDGARPLLIRKPDGISPELDRIAALGNAIVPQVAMVIMEGIKQIDNLI